MRTLAAALLAMVTTVATVQAAPIISLDGGTYASGGTAYIWYDVNTEDSVDHSADVVLKVTYAAGPPSYFFLEDADSEFDAGAERIYMYGDKSVPAAYLNGIGWQLIVTVDNGAGIWTESMAVPIPDDCPY